MHSVSFVVNKGFFISFRVDPCLKSLDIFIEISYPHAQLVSLQADLECTSILTVSWDGSPLVASPMLSKLAAISVALI